MFVFNLSLCRVSNVLSPPQHETINPKGMEVVSNVIEACDKEAGQSYC